MIALRTSTEASTTMSKTARLLRVAFASRSLRTMFSTSMIASSTTTPMDTTSPASTMTLIVWSCRSSTISAMISDSGIEIRLMNVVRHSIRKAIRMSTTSRMPISSEVVRLSIAVWMKVAGRKIVVSTVIPVNAGWSSAIAASSPRVTSRVLVSGNFWTTSRMPARSFTTPSPHVGP